MRGFKGLFARRLVLLADYHPECMVISRGTLKYNTMHDTSSISLAIDTNIIQIIDLFSSYK